MKLRALSVAGLLLAAAGYSTAAAGQEPTTLRILAYNIHHGAGNDEVLDLQRIAALIRSLEPDLVALQEIDNVVERTGGVNQAAELGRLTGMGSVFGPFMDYQGGELVFAGIHLYRTAEERMAQARRLLEVLQNESAPVILAGDFNSTPDSDVMVFIGDSFVIPSKGDDHLTFRSDRPEREIDFIAYRPADRFRVVESRVIDEPVASDHRPVLLVLELQ